MDNADRHQIVRAITGIDPAVSGSVEINGTTPTPRLLACPPYSSCSTFHTLDDADPGNTLAMGSTLVAAVRWDAVTECFHRLGHEVELDRIAALSVSGQCRGMVPLDEDHDDPLAS